MEGRVVDSSTALGCSILSFLSAGFRQLRSDKYNLLLKAHNEPLPVLKLVLLSMLERSYRASGP